MDGRWLLTLNAGSSSLKFGVFDLSNSLRCRLRGVVGDIGRDSATLTAGDSSQDFGCVNDPASAACALLDRLEIGVGDFRLRAADVTATGHRIVHGGPEYAHAVRIDDETFAKLEALNHLAPLHNPHSLAVVKAVGERFPQIPAVAEFDTAFFHALPDFARTYAIPADLAERYGIRRFGFHGLAHQYMSRHFDSCARHRADSRLISLQLGQGCSVAAMSQGRPVETSMGFTPLEGLVMGTRCGDIDGGILLYLSQQGLSPSDLEDLLNRRSGLLGLSGESDDIRALLELESRQHAGATLALAVFCHRIIKYVGAYAAVLGGVDALIIGGGIGENSPAIRARVCSGLEWLGLELDTGSNAACIGTAERISTDASSIEVHVVPIDEELVIAKATLKVLQGDDPQSAHA